MEMTTLHIVLVLVLVCTLGVSSTAAATMCYKCDHVAHPRDCDKIVQCQDGESCHVISYAQPDGHFYYVTGCLAKQSCPSSSFVGKRDIAFCNRCCDGNYCNKELCDGPAPVQHGPRCAKCDTVEHPSHCLAITECPIGEKCLTYEKYVFGERRYQLGCTTGQGTCLPPVSRRSLLERQARTCLSCCDGENCNRETCTNTGNPVIAATKTAPVTLPTVQHTNPPVQHTNPPVQHTNPPAGTTHVYHFGGCYYKGTKYQTGDKWEDGCDYSCTCVNADTGRYTCQDICPTYINVPSNCQMVKAPGECCSHPDCHGTGITMTNYTSTTLINDCLYKGIQYKQGATWRDGCQFECECTDASRGYYHCRSLCYTWNLPIPPCKLDPPASGKCCQTPNCPTGFTIKYPPGYVEN